MEPYSDSFHSVVHTAISRRTFPLATEGLKSLGPTGYIQPPATVRAQARRNKAERVESVGAFLLACNEEPNLKSKVIRKHIWRSVGHKSPRQFQYWQSGKHRGPGQSHGATELDGQNFGRILKMAPRDFVALIEKKGLI